MGIKSIILRIPWLGPSTNEVIGKHWSIYHKHKESAEIALRVALSEQFSNQTVSIDTPAKVTFRAFLGPKRHAFDLDNYSTSYKILVDCCVDVGILPDDRDKYVSAFEIQRACRFKEWHKKGMPKDTHVMLQIRCIYR
ncbi:MAG TPA: hypothetical protein ENH82_05640 [bacterium]|nr:hypothetical protein [bacterium]